MKYELTDEMKKDRLNCGEDADCNECSCQIGTDDCIYNHITTVADYIKKMNNNQLAIYLHSWQTENMSVEEIKDLLNSEHTLEDVPVEQSKKCTAYEDDCEEWAGCPCANYRTTD